MNINKARDFFSAYYEGELGGGIKEAFERSLTTDPALKAEYEEFVEIMKMLEEPVEEVPAPHDLHDKIMARLDHESWQEKQTVKAGFFGNWKLAFVGALALVAIVAGGLSVVNRGSGSDGLEAGLGGQIPSANVTEKVDVVALDGKLVLNLEANAGSKYQLRTYGSTDVIEEVSLKGTSFETEINTKSPETVALEVINAKGEPKLLMVHPGTQSESLLVGEGSIVDCAKAIATTFRTPILIRVPDPEQHMSWNFEATDDFNIRSTKLAASKLSLSLREDGVSILTPTGS
ncbi:MAG: hypothetical protein KF824_01740 [Fimbriimonadaceae bacterium]|nr:MAG: hypothetical protein KF824_01740 [Fimbriimonadaceae bacterium]